MLIKVLHVTESLGGGVTSAINAYVANSAQYQHYLFATVRTGDATGEEDKGLFLGIRLVRRRVFAICDLIKYVKALNPDVVHVHSTYAGFFVRLIPFVSKKKIVYTPHAYAFLRNDSWVKLKVYYLIEKILSHRVSVVAGCGLDECNISKKLNSDVPVVELVNVCGDLPDLHCSDKGELPVVCMLGRVSEQKGFQYFAEVSASLQGKARFKWIGGGDEEGVELLKRSGVEVTGWIPRIECLQHLVNSDLYFHTAQWDGFPISVLEASNYKLPLVLRDIGPFTAEGLSVVGSSSDAVDFIGEWINNNAYAVDVAWGNQRMISNHHTSDRLSNSLKKLYSKFV